MKVSASPLSSGDKLYVPGHLVSAGLSFFFCESGRKYGMPT